MLNEGKDIILRKTILLIQLNVYALYNATLIYV